MKISVAIILCFVFLTIGCDQSIAQSVDGSSKEAYERSLQKMVDSLREEEKEAWQEGLINLIIERYPPASGVTGFELFALLPAAVEAAPVTMDGVTFVEILSRGNAVLAKKREGKKQENKAFDERAEKVKCLQSKIVLSNPTLTSDSSYARMDVYNGLDWAIAGLRVQYTILSEGREVPWDKGITVTSISGGIEPGETRNVSIYIGGVSRDAPKNKLQPSILVLDAADAEKRLYVGDVRVIDWSEEATPNTCEQ